MPQFDGPNDDAEGVNDTDMDTESLEDEDSGGSFTDDDGYDEEAAHAALADADGPTVKLSPTIVVQDDDSVDSEDGTRYNDDAHVGLEKSARFWLRSHGVTFNLASNSFFWKGSNMSIKEIAKQLHASKTWVTDRGRVMRQSEALWTTIVTGVAREHRHNAITMMRTSLCNAPRTSDEELRRFLRELLQPTIADDEFENALAVVKHWLWLVQRQILDFRTSWHIMPIFWGGGGGGKSEQIKQLLGPVGAFAIMDANFSVFSDGFSQLQMHRSFVMFMDEMENAEKTDSQSIKRCISGEHIGGRGMHSDDGRKLKRNASFIAATNTPPPHGLKDDSSARRYYSLECRPGPISAERIEFFNSLDYRAMWTCVNPYVNRSPILPRQAAVAAVQHAVNRSRSMYEDFINERCERVEGATYLYRDLTRDLKSYIEDRKLSQANVPSYNQLKTELTALGYESRNTNNVPRVLGLLNRTAAAQRRADAEMNGLDADADADA